LEIKFRRRPKVGHQLRRRVWQAARAEGRMISRDGVTDKWRKPRVSRAGQPKDNIRSNPEVTPRAALEGVTYRSNPASYNKRDDWTRNGRRKLKIARPAWLKDTVTGASWRPPGSRGAGECGRRKPEA
jgi:hypothetical protein